MGVFDSGGGSVLGGVDSGGGSVMGVFDSGGGGSVMGVFDSGGGSVVVVCRLRLLVIVDSPYNCVCSSLRSLHTCNKFHLYTK